MLKLMAEPHCWPVFRYLWFSTDVSAALSRWYELDIPMLRLITACYVVQEMSFDCRGDSLPPRYWLAMQMLTVSQGYRQLMSINSSRCWLNTSSLVLLVVV
jgi:hypothetical protein